MSVSDNAETILIVDDQEPVRRTFAEWLESADLGCHLLTAADAAAALALADRQMIDLAILDWHLGAGHDGLQLLEDLTVFNPDVVAIMVTGFAHQATPLMAMRMGVRDYLDKNQDLNRDTFLRAVTRQLERIRPARREKRLNLNLANFRAAVERILPLVQTTQALHDPVPLPVAIRSLMTFLLEATNASQGVLLVHSYDASREPAEVCRAYDHRGQVIDGPLVPFARSLAGTVVSLQEPQVMTDLPRVSREGTIELQPFELTHRTLLAAPISVSPGLQVVVELFDKADETGFTPGDRHLLRVAATFGGDLLRQALAEQQTRRVLFDAVATALRASDEVSQTLNTSAQQRVEDPPSPDVLEQLHAGLRGSAADEIDTSALLRLAEAIRVLALRYGPSALNHCTRLVQDLRHLLDEVSGTGEEGRA
jgi:ActR/RegA family two-component response regulator